MTFKSIVPALACAASLLSASAAMAETLAEKVQAATARFADVTVAVSEGYGPIPCASGSSGGGMGIHYVNGKHLKDNALDVANPEAVMYEPQKDGSLVLVGVEYITFRGPAALKGHLFEFHGSPNRYGLDPFYELHVWAHRPNPNGVFASANKDVSCEFAGE